MASVKSPFSNKLVGKLSAECGGKFSVVTADPRIYNFL